MNQLLFVKVIVMRTNAEMVFQHSRDKELICKVVMYLVYLTFLFNRNF